MNLFDDLMLLSDGHLLYFGPVQDALTWFSSLGFERPPRKDPCSFLQELTVPIGQLKYASDSMLKEKGLEAMAATARNPHALAKSQVMKFDAPIPLNEMSEVFNKLNASALAMRADLDEQGRKTASLRWPIKGLYKKAYASKPYQLALAVYRRQRALVKGQRGFFIARMLQALIMGALRGSMFWQIPLTAAGGRLILSCNTTTVVFLSMLSSTQVAIVFNYKPVFIKQRNDFFYPPWSFALALFLTQIFQSLMEAAIYSIAIYFMAGFTYSASYFFRFYLVTFVASITLAGLTRFIAFALPSKVLATSCLSCVILINQITNGFNILYGDIPDWMIWLYWLNPVQYALSALNVLELTSPKWNVTSGNSTEPLGIQVLQTYDMKTDVNWVYFSVAYLLGMLTVLTVASAIVLRWTTLSGVQNSVDDDNVDETTLLTTPSIKNNGMEKVLPTNKSATDDSVNMAVPNVDTSPQKDEGHKPVTVVCRNLSYCVPTPKGAKPTPNAIKPGMLQILTDITLYAKPGCLTALMGGSGSGKTTLMDVVCGRKTIGHISGEILINGHPVDKASWPRMHGYVEQQNLHSPQLTVEEALMFSGSLRLPQHKQDSTSVQAAVEDTLQITELTSLRSKVTGTPLGGGLSSEALKRLSIAVELVANPSVLFLDEPTTGLDARAAAIVVRALEGIATTGRTIMVTM
jgi:ABC-type Mn2+/Zn2+ transport system ATPase subunit/ABC-type multidrug transport system permease subunit